jgi:alanyl-tRNA synthetase
MITRKQLISKYIDFFKSKNHKEIPNSSLIPENDPTVLFTTAGMHPLVPFLLGQKHPLGKRLCGIQKCIRTGDIEEVGDRTHHTFFEMLGNWSLGDYWKEDAIRYSFEFLTKELKIPKEKIEVSCFAGDKDAQKDEESERIWKSSGIKKIKFLGKEDNWWGPAGKTGPCGPDTEMFVNGVEIWNDVFMQYYKDEKGKYLPAKQKNIDTGMGVERTIAILNDIDDNYIYDNYLTDCFLPIITKIEKISGKKYENLSYMPQMRIIADHIKASVFIIADGISPGNTEQGYVLRRLIRRAVRYGKNLDMKNFTEEIAKPVFEIYNDYSHLQKNKQKILDELKREEEKFNETLEKAIKIFNSLTQNKKELDCKEAFLLYQSYGFPLEMIEEECKARNIKFSIKEFNKECKIHQELSRTASAGKFKSGLADNSKETTRLHTATHLLLAAIRKILRDNSINQKGSNITAERLRFDFNFPRKLTEEELKNIEKEVNSNIKKGCNVIREEMPLEEAKKKGVTGVFEHKYGDIVSVYTIENCSKEICAGPHVKNTCELGKFKIIKEESSSNGVRRIKGVVE